MAFENSRWGVQCNLSSAATAATVRGGLVTQLQLHTLDTHTHRPTCMHTCMMVPGRRLAVSATLLASPPTAEAAWSKKRPKTLVPAAIGEAAAAVGSELPPALMLIRAGAGGAAASALPGLLPLALAAVAAATAA